LRDLFIALSPVDENFCLQYVRADSSLLALLYENSLAEGRSQAIENCKAVSAKLEEAAEFPVKQRILHNKPASEISEFLLR